MEPKRGEEIFLGVMEANMAGRIKPGNPTTCIQGVYVDLVGMEYVLADRIDIPKNYSPEPTLRLIESPETIIVHIPTGKVVIRQPYVKIPGGEPIYNDQGEATGSQELHCMGNVMTEEGVKLFRLLLPKKPKMSPMAAYENWAARHGGPASLE